MPVGHDSIFRQYCLFSPCDRCSDIRLFLVFTGPIIICPATLFSIKNLESRVHCGISTNVLLS